MAVWFGLVAGWAGIDIAFDFVPYMGEVDITSKSFIGSGETRVTLVVMRILKEPFVCFFGDAESGVTIPDHHVEELSGWVDTKIMLGHLWSRIVRGSPLDLLHNINVNAPEVFVRAKVLDN